MLAVQMSGTSLETAPTVPAQTSERDSAADARGRGSWPRRHPWWAVSAALVVFAAIFVDVTGTRPGYDPYGWLVWGYQTLRLTLDLGGAPSWKPYPYLITVPLSVFGHYALYLWMVISSTVSFAGCIFAGRIAYRLANDYVPAGHGRGVAAPTETPAGRPYAAIAAAVFAGLAVLGIANYTHFILSFQSDPMLVTMCLAAVDCHLSGHRRWAFWFGVLASLGRPEAWPFLGLYAIWLWREHREMRWMIYAGLALIPALWFGIPWITNGRPDIAGQLAQLSPRELHHNKIVGTIARFHSLNYLPVWIAAGVAVLIALWRRHVVALVIAAGCAGWVIVEIAFALHGWPAVPRYMFEAAGVTIALAGAAVGWVLKEARALGRNAHWAGIALVAVLVGTLIPGAVSRGRIEHKDLRHERARTTEINLLSTTIAALGGYKHILYCGRPVTTVEYVSILAWNTKLDDGFVGHKPHYELTRTYPIVLFTELPNGWAVKPWHTASSRVSACSNLKAAYVQTPSHPHGVLVRG